MWNSQPLWHFPNRCGIFVVKRSVKFLFDKLVPMHIEQKEKTEQNYYI